MAYFAGGRHLSTHGVVFFQQMAVEQEEERAASGALRFNQSSCECQCVQHGCAASLRETGAFAECGCAGGAAQRAVC
jgi:hypothetical protein